MKLIMLVIIIGLAVTSFFYHGQATTAQEETAAMKLQAENVSKVVTDVRGDTTAVQKQLDDTARQLAETKEAARKLTEDQAQTIKQTQEQMQEQTEARAKQTAELEEVKKKLADNEAQLATLQTEFATAKAQATAAKDELTKLQEKNRLPPLGTTTGKKP